MSLRADGKAATDRPRGVKIVACRTISRVAEARAAVFPRLVVFFSVSLCLCGELPALPRLQENSKRFSHSKKKSLELHAAAEIVGWAQGRGELVGFAGG